MKKNLTPVSDYLIDLLRTLMQTIFSLRNAYEACFDRFECLMALVYADRSEKTHHTGIVSERGYAYPIGRNPLGHRWVLSARRNTNFVVIHHKGQDCTDKPFQDWQVIRCWNR
jgi:hypothetical protein